MGDEDARGDPGADFDAVDHRGRSNGGQPRCHRLVADGRLRYIALMTSAPPQPGLSRAQRLITKWVGPETAAAMEAHSRAWLVRCPHCEHERSMWEVGGIRYKASGNPRMRMQCPNCGRKGWHKVYKSADFPVTSVPAWPLVRLFLYIGLYVGLALLILIAVILSLVLKLTGAI